MRKTRKIKFNPRAALFGGNYENIGNEKETSLTLGVGEKYDLNSSLPSGEAAYSIVYSNSDSSVASVKSGGGVVTGVAEGSTTITVKLSNGVSAKCSVKVVAAKKGTKKTTSVSSTLMSDPSWSSKNLGTVKSGSVVYKFGTKENGRWIKVKYGSKYGWLYNKSFGAGKNYSKVTTSTLPVVADDIIFDKGLSIKNLFNYVYNLGYRNASKSSVENLCVYMLNNGRGACYHHAALLYYLLDRAGFEAIWISDGIDDYTGGGPHSWVMVKTSSGWRHIDPTPIIGLSKFYLVTDDKISPYFSWDTSKYPAAK